PGPSPFPTAPTTSPASPWTSPTSSPSGAARPASPLPGAEGPTFRARARRGGGTSADVGGSSDPSAGLADLRWRPWASRATEGAPPMDVSAVIVEAHAELERLFAAYEGAGGGTTARGRTLGAIAGALGVHET